MLLYIHIPFCASKCGYCAFNSVVDSKDIYPMYIQALCEDIRISLERYIPHGKLQSVFIGGGTPNILPAHYYDDIFASFWAYTSRDCEISIESNVNLITTAWCKTLYNLGANRISVGVQSFNPKKLAFLERDHSIKDIAGAFESIQKSGFSNINCDMIYDTPLDSHSSLKQEFENLKNLPLTHISAYSLSIDVDSRFEGREHVLPKESLSYEVREILDHLGFSQYEVSNYAKHGAYCRHNIGYWELKEYIGCGAGAFGRVGNARSMAHKNIKHYIANPHYRVEESLSDADLNLEAIMLGLRCKSGVAYELIKSHRNLALLLDSHKIHKVSRTNMQGKQCEYIIADDMLLADELAMWLS